MAKLLKSQVLEQAQNEVVKKYRLGKHDRSILIFGGIAGSTGVFCRKREEAATKKLIRLGLLEKVKVKYGYDFLLTKTGWEVHSKVYSNF